MRATGNARDPLHAADANLGLQRVCVAAVEELKSLSHQCLLRTAHNDTMRREELQARAARLRRLCLGEKMESDYKSAS